MNRLREAINGSNVLRPIRMPGLLWNELVEHRKLTAIDRSDTMQAMLVGWIEAGLRREQQELDSENTSAF